MQDEFLVMASDGLFDVMEDQSVIDTVGSYLREHKRLSVRLHFKSIVLEFSFLRCPRSRHRSRPHSWPATCLCVIQ